MLELHCVIGGEKPRSRGSGKRDRSTMRSSCPVMLKLLASVDGKKLWLSSMVSEHNHEVSEALFRHLPQQRKLSDDEREEVMGFLAMDANKKLIQERMQSKTGKVIVLRDLTNIAAKVKCREQDAATIVRTLREKYGATTEVLKDKSNQLTGLFFQDPDMHRIYQAYPELICVDATYKLNNLRMPLYLILVEDGNGKSEIAAAAILASENRESLKWLFESFKKHNEHWPQTVNIMSDKDMNEREAIGDAFPQASMHVCLFHTLRTFRREVTEGKMGITSGQRMTALRILQKIAYSQNEEEYKKNLTLLEESCPSAVTQYVKANWDPIREEWVLGMKNTYTLLNNTNNRLECLNQKVKSVVGRYSTLPEFISRFFVLVHSLRGERDQDAANIVHKRKVMKLPEDAPERKYCEVLTPYAASLVNQQLSRKASPNSQYKTMQNECNCSFYNATHLPCCHIFQLRAEQGLPKYDNDLCPLRWTTAFYKSQQRIFVTHQDQHMVTPRSAGVSVEQQQIRPISQHARYRTAIDITSKLASVASETAGQIYQNRITSLRRIYEMWCQGKEVTITEKQDDIDAQEATEVMVVDRMDQEEEREHGGDNKEGEEDQAEEEEVGQDKEIRQEEREDDLTAVGLLQEMHLTVIKSPEVEMMEEERLKECEVTQDNETVSEVNDDELVHLLEELRAESTNVDAPNALEVNEGRTENQQKGEVQEVTAQEKGDDHQAKEVQMKDAFDDLKGLRLPPKMKKRGRPKGQECTVVGLPKRKKRQTIPFSRLHPCEKDQAVVSWLVGEELAKRSILRGYMIEEVDVEVRPEKLPSRILDEQVDVNRMRKYFTKDAWSLVQDVVAAKRNDPRWTCPICNLDLDDIDSPTLGCDACLEWFHLKCLGKASQPKAAKWFCSVCRNATHRNSQN